MSLRQNLTKPLVVEPTDDHAHTVIFLHRFPEETTEEELRSKILAQKLTKNHKTLQEQFPAVRWVFPHPKAHARHWGNLSAGDKAELGLNLGGLPYITQVIVQESKRVGGLDKVILGGQGETAEAAHEAMSSFPELSQAQRASPEAMAGFIQEYFHPSWTEMTQLKLAGFVGMHAQGGPVTRDAKNFGIASKLPGVKSINNTIVTNTSHKFIQGGYKLQTATWDGKRIDDFAGFLVDTGVYRTKESSNVNNGNSGIEQLTPKDRSGSQQNSGKKADAKDQLNDVQKHALQVMKEKKATEQTRNRILQRIEADKVERKIRQERQRQSRRAREGKEVWPQSDPANSLEANDTARYGTSSLSSAMDSQHLYSPKTEDGSHAEGGEDMVEDEALLAEFSRENSARNAHDLAQMNQQADGDSEWSPQLRGEMSTTQMKALGLANEQDGDVPEEGQHIKTEKE